MRKLALSFVMLATVAACATPNLDEPPPLLEDEHPIKHGKSTEATPMPSASGSSELPPADGTPPRDAGVDIDADASPERWHGSLSATSPVSFGGGKYCTYRITLKQVNVDVTADRLGAIVTASASGLAVEDVTSSNCSTPIPVNTHHFTLTQATLLTSGITHLELAGATTNQPHTSLVIEGDFRNENPLLSLHLHRTDQVPPLDWAVNTQLTVFAQ